MVGGMWHSIFFVSCVLFYILQSTGRTFYITVYKYSLQVQSTGTVV